MISTMIERDFMHAIERQQRLLEATAARQARVQRSRHGASHWLSTLHLGWWPSRER